MKAIKDYVKYSFKLMLLRVTKFVTFKFLIR